MASNWKLEVPQFGVLQFGVPPSVGLFNHANRLKAEFQTATVDVQSVIYCCHQLWTNGDCHVSTIIDMARD